jgi:PhoH-like ATPase
MIISTALAIQNSEPKRKVIVVTRDINMRVKCDSVGIESEDYIEEKMIKNSTELYSGTEEVLVGDEDIEKFYKGESVVLNEKQKLYPNQFVMLISDQNQKKTALAKFTKAGQPLKKIQEFKGGVQGIKPNNKEQKYALNLLMDPDIEIVTLEGIPGGGKTILSLAAGLEQVLKTKEYEKILVMKPIIPIGNDVGYLPGSLEEKLLPWLAPIKDNLELIAQLDRNQLNGSSMKDHIDSGIIEIETLTYVRGRSINNAFIIFDEMQNINFHELKTIMTRVGYGSKIIGLGCINQIDNLRIDETSNGLTCAVEKFKPFSLSGHVTLLKGERSDVASLAAKIL